jgi:hypothetical protein
MNHEELKALVKSAKSAAATDWEKAFTKEQSARVAKWGEKTMMSEKQIACLQKIAGQAEEDGEAAKPAKPKKEKEIDDDIPF